MPLVEQKLVTLLVHSRLFSGVRVIQSSVFYKDRFFNSFMWYIAKHKIED
jgi:hypothetical protein